MQTMTLGSYQPDWRRAAAATRSWRLAKQIQNPTERKKAIRAHFEEFMPAPRCRVHR